MVFILKSGRGYTQARDNLGRNLENQMKQFKNQKAPDENEPITDLSKGERIEQMRTIADKTKNEKIVKIAHKEIEFLKKI